MARHAAVPPRRPRPRDAAREAVHGQLTRGQRPVHTVLAGPPPPRRGPLRSRICSRRPPRGRSTRRPGGFRYLAPKRCAGPRGGGPPGWRVSVGSMPIVSMKTGCPPSSLGLRADDPVVRREPYGGGGQPVFIVCLRLGRLGLTLGASGPIVASWPTFRGAIPGFLKSSPARVWPTGCFRRGVLRPFRWGRARRPARS